MRPFALVVIALVFWAHGHFPMAVAPSPEPSAACSPDGADRRGEGRGSTELPDGGFGTAPPRAICLEALPEPDSRAFGPEDWSAAS